ncbi:MAG: hypothetical protein KF780_11090 [Sphingomonas sp.]|nr:hypothetical protein [Sphingomonas sp.]
MMFPRRTPAAPSSVSPFLKANMRRTPPAEAGELSMLKSVPLDLVLVVIVFGALKWLMGPLLGREGMFAAAVILAVGWVLLANWRHRLRRLAGSVLPRFLRETGPR